jgi:hypothetical protein
MASRQRELFAEPIDGKENEFLVGEVYYSKGGRNYFSGSISRRGYYFSVVPETRKDGMRSFLMSHGGKVLLEETKAFSAKKFEQVNPTPEQIADLKAKVLASEKACNLEQAHHYRW